jgi:hypothetical protein
LEKLGFPWIISSKSRLFNGLRGIFREENFSRLFPGAEGVPERARALLEHSEAQIVSWDKLNLVSDFLQEIAGSYSVSCGFV